MTERMLRFTHTAKTMPAKRDAQDRSDDFHEIYAEFIAAKAEEQAARCSQCGVPFCQVHCPLHNNIPDWLRLTAEGRLREAYDASAATNFMPEICGRICPQDRLCEGNCVIEQSGHGTVTIGAVEKYLTETAWDQGWVAPIRVGRDQEASVGIIGAGPGGLAAAEALRARGYQVHVYDRYDRIGGLLIYGIPNFKLEKQVVERRAARLRDAGINFHMECDVGRDIAFSELRARHDAVLIATGVYQARRLDGPHLVHKDVVPALAYLTASNRKGLGDAVAAFKDGTLNAEGRKVVVIGGGDTAMDCVRTAVRQGAASVTCLYRRDRENMPGSQREVTHAEEEGVRFEWLSAPVRVLETGRISGVQATRMRLGWPDDSGRRAPEPVPGSEFTLDADMVIEALGFEPDPLRDHFAEHGLRTAPGGTLSIDPETKETALEGVYAAGDIVRGASLVVWAIRDGMDAAHAIDRRLSGLSPAGQRAATAKAIP